MLSSSSSNPLPSSGPPSLPGAIGSEYDDPGARAIDLTNRPVADSLREIMASSPRLPPAMPPPLPPVAPQFANRHGTLAVFGLLSLLCAFLIAGASVWLLVEGGWDGFAQDPSARTLVLVEAPVSISFSLIIGLGLIFARRWARQLSLAIFVEAILWVLASATAIGINNFPDFTAPLSAEDDVAAWQYLAALGVAAAVSWLLLAVLSHRNVRLTCESAQPVPDWTDDRSPSELLLFCLMVSSATAWAGLASYHDWPCWGVWRGDSIPLVWGGAAALAAVAASLSARGNAAGPILAIALASTAASSIIVTAIHRPMDEERWDRRWGHWDDWAPLWDGWDFNRPGGLAFTALTALITVTVALAALRSQWRRKKSTAAPDAP